MNARVCLSGTLVGTKRIRCQRLSPHLSEPHLLTEHACGVSIEYTWPCTGEEEFLWRRDATQEATDA